MRAFRIASCVFVLLALGTEVDASEVSCFRNHYILDLPCNVSQPPFPQGPAAGRWMAIGPDGANVMALVIDPVTPSIAFAGTIGAGVLKTTDGGANWATANVGLATTNIVALAIDPSTPNTLYATTDLGVFKSTNGGQSWAAANLGLDWQGDVVYTLTIDPRSPATVYAGTPAGIFKTTNGAATWTPVNAGFAGPVQLITIDPTSASTLYIRVDDNAWRTTVLKSTDGGASWASIYATDCDWGCDQYSVAALAIDSQSPSRLYLLASGGLKASADGGASWSDIATPPEYILYLSVDPTSFATVYIHTSPGGTYRTTDAGKTWTPVADGPLTAAGIRVIAIPASMPSTIYAGGGTGVFRSVDRAQTWTRLTLGVRSVSVSPVAVDPSTPSTIYAPVGPWNALTATTDGGSHWAASSSLSARVVDSLTIDPVSPSTLYALTHAMQGGASLLYKTTDAGAHWMPASDLRLDQSDPLAIAPTQPSTLYVGDNLSDRGILKSTDGGASWGSHGAIAAGQEISALAVDPTTADTVYAATLYPSYPWLSPMIFKSTDGAAHWERLMTALPPGTSVNSIAVDPAEPSTIYVSYALYYSPTGPAGVFKSSDRGGTWVAASQGLPATGWVGALVIGAPSHVYVATSEGVFASSDGATSWTPINAGLPNVFIGNLSVDRASSVLRTATIAGLFEYRLSASPPSTSAAVVEYYHAAFDHYFITANPDEIAALDRGAIAGWTRTGFQFRANAASASGTSPVCRFFSAAFAPKSSHFYTAFASECAAVRANPTWLLESSAAFYVTVPAADGSCAAGSTPIFRLYNNGQGGAPNHRYTTDLATRAAMIQRGWTPEGLVAMCSSP